MAFSSVSTFQPAWCGSDRETREKFWVHVFWFQGWPLGGGRLVAIMNSGVVGVDPAVVAGWVPVAPVADQQTLDVVLPLARSWVLAAAPVDAHSARRMLRAVTGMLVWADSVIGTTDKETVLCPDNVELWVMHVHRGRSRMWRHVTRAALRHVGRANNPDGWPTVPVPIRRAGVAEAYDAAAEETFKLAADLMCGVDRPAGLWVTAGSLGAGMSGVELAAARVGDVTELAAGLVIGVRGRNPRLVPVRRAWTVTVADAVDAAGSVGGVESRFVTARGRNAVHGLVQRLAPVGGEALSLSRARSTFLAAHLTACTPLPVLRMFAGPVSMNTLDELAGVAGGRLDPVAVCLRGLGV